MALHQEAIRQSTAQVADATFGLTLGGRYMVMVIGTFNSSHVDLQVLGPDLTTWVAVKQAYDASSAEEDEPINQFSAAGAKIFDLPPGQYKLAINSATNFKFTVARISIE